jgi:conjugative relaxase-like TrwC/TraI family protein
VAWMRMMGAESVGYHRETVLERGDDHPGAALDYYASRGETPLVWGGRGAQKLGLSGAVGEAEYDAIYGPGGAKHPASGARLVAAKRPGMELVVAAHKSVALLGIVGRAEDMHAILDAETDATLAYLDAWMTERGGRRGRAQTRTKTGGLVWSRTRHATSRAGDPEPHDHVLIANLCQMADERGGWKALDTAALRDLVHAATAFGRVASAAKATELGYAIEADDGPSGRLGHWRIAGMPEGACQLFSKRSAEITAAVESKGYATYQARQMAARDTRKAKRHTPPGELMPAWLAELEAAGYTPDSLLDSVNAAAETRAQIRPRLAERQLSALVAHTLGPSGRLAEIKVFTRADVAVAVAPYLFGRHPGELLRVVEAVCAHPDAIALVGVAAAKERAYAPACVLANESAIAGKVALQANRDNAPRVPTGVTDRAIAAKEQTLAGKQLTTSQRAMIASVCSSGRGAELILGVAGAGKTTALDVVRDAFETAGYTVIGTSTSGQAARTLGREAGIGESATMASLLWRIDHQHVVLDERSVVILDEAGMADDPSVLRLLTAAEQAGSKVVMVGDHRQLGAVGPGGTLEGLVARYSNAVHVLDQNVRQVDRSERQALGELRAGKIETAVEWYCQNDRIRTAVDRDRALDTMVGAWAADVAAGKEAAMFAWRRANVAALNTRARAAMAEAGKLTGAELKIDGQAFAAGDRIVTLAPGAKGQLVTSERGIIQAVDPQARSLVARMDDGRTQTFGPDETSAERLAHGYATTVHRSQGATVDVAHLFADGGGRELGYVGMSRARHTSHVHVVADNIGQAAEDLVRDWSQERRQVWAIDTGTPTTEGQQPEQHPLEIETAGQAPQGLSAALRRARLVAERQALATNLKAAVPDDPEPALAQLTQLDRNIGALNRRLTPPDPRIAAGLGHPESHHIAPPEPAGPSLTPGL